MLQLTRKQSGSYYTPSEVVDALLSWGVTRETDRLLDPSCGDGRFIAGHRNSVGIERDASAAIDAFNRAPWASIHTEDFFSWAEATKERFDCSVGNPPFIRYQTFTGDTRARALRLSAEAGALFTGLSSSWAPFLVVAATLLKPGGRLAFVVPAEIGHAPYAAPLMEFLVAKFAVVHVVAVRAKLFPQLSEDCWLLYAEGYTGQTSTIRFSAISVFKGEKKPPKKYTSISVSEWRSQWNSRLRPYLMSREGRSLYRDAVESGGTRRLGDLASVGIGYVTGANDFFHLRPSDAERLAIPESFLFPSVRNGRALPKKRLTPRDVEQWRSEDQQMLLLRIEKKQRLPRAVEKYLDSDAAKAAQSTYKCRNRDPWYSVPDVQVPDLFLSYMSGDSASLVSNEAGSTCTNSVHSVRLRNGVKPAALLKAWDTDFARLSCEIEGHPLGGGMLKIEPREAGRIALPVTKGALGDQVEVVLESIGELRRWRLHDQAN